MGWSYDGTHPATVIFTAALETGAPLRFAPWMQILEIGCAEHDWLTLASSAWPETYFVGIDTRAQDTSECDGRILRRQADAMNPELFAPGSFDAVVSLSAIEHIGLGHYGDPLDADGDSKAVANAWRWLKPGGWLYLDVPYSPVGYRVCGTSHRQYDDEALFRRLVPAEWSANNYRGGLWSGYAHRNACGTLVDRPTIQGSPEDFDHYVAMLWQKA